MWAWANQMSLPKNLRQSLSLDKGDILNATFSKELIDETIKVFKEEDNLDLSLEQAEEYLNSLAGLFLAYSGKKSAADFGAGIKAPRQNEPPL